MLFAILDSFASAICVAVFGTNAVYGDGELTDTLGTPEDPAF